MTACLGEVQRTGSDTTAHSPVDAIPNSSATKSARINTTRKVERLGHKMADRNEVKALLARAGVEIADALKTVDSADDAELNDVAAKVRAVEAAFFDFNGSCGTLEAADLAAFFDFNGSCGSSRLGRALNDAVTNVRPRQR